jgi:tRNA threonylcarbamoyl adenosine modification protein YeaZ
VQSFLASGTASATVGPGDHDHKRRRPDSSSKRGVGAARPKIPGVLLLAIDTSTPTVTAGVVSLLRPHELTAGAVAGGPELRHDPVQLQSEHSVTDPFAHAEKLMPLVNAALSDAGHTLRDLDAVVVGLGPGPFTGLRVGIATAQALGDALDIPVHGIGSHDAAARAHLANTGDQRLDDFLVVTDARRREVYLSAYSGRGAKLFGPAPVAPSAVALRLAEHAVRPRLMIGAGVALLAGKLDDVVAGSEIRSLSVGLVLAAARALVTDVVPGPLVPLYLRRPDSAEPGARKSVLGS